MSWIIDDPDTYEVVSTYTECPCGGPFSGNTEGWAEGAEHGWRHAMIEVRRKIEALWPEIHEWMIAQEAVSASMTEDSRG